MYSVAGNGCINCGYCMAPNTTFPCMLVQENTCGNKTPTLRCRRPLTAAGGAVQAHEHPRGGGAGGGVAGAHGAAVGTAARPAQQVGYFLASAGSIVCKRNSVSNLQTKPRFLSQRSARHLLHFTSAVQGISRFACINCQAVTHDPKLTRCQLLVRTPAADPAAADLS